MYYLSSQGLYVESKRCEPEIEMFRARFVPAIKHLKLNKHSKVLILGSYYGWLEKHLFYNGVNLIGTVEPHPIHVKHMEATLDSYNLLDFKTPFQTWHIVEGAVHNTYDIGCEYSYCIDDLKVPKTSSAYSSLEKRVFFEKLERTYYVRKYRLRNILYGFANEGIRFTHMIADYDGVCATLIDDYNPEFISDFGLKVLFYASHKEIKALKDKDYFDNLETFYNYNSYSVTKLPNNFYILKEM